MMLRRMKRISVVFALCFGTLDVISPQLNLVPPPPILREQGLRDRAAAPSPKSPEGNRTEQKAKHRVQEVGVSGKKNKCQMTSVTEQDFKWPLFTVNLVILINRGGVWLC